MLAESPSLTGRGPYTKETRSTSSNNHALMDSVGPGTCNITSFQVGGERSPQLAAEIPERMDPPTRARLEAQFPSCHGLHVRQFGLATLHDNLPRARVDQSIGVRVVAARGRALLVTLIVNNLAQGRNMPTPVCRCGRRSKCRNGKRQVGERTPSVAC